MRAANQNFVAGLVFAGVGLFGLWAGRGLNVGTAAEMGEGYFPLLMCKFLIAVGALISVIGLVAGGAPLERLRWRPLLLVTCSVLIFAVVLEPLGVIAAITGTVILANFAGEVERTRSVVMLAAVISLAVLAIFVWGLGLPIHALPPGLF